MSEEAAKEQAVKVDVKIDLGKVGRRQQAGKRSKISRPDGDGRHKAERKTQAGQRKG